MTEDNDDHAADEVNEMTIDTSITGSLANQNVAGKGSGTGPGDKNAEWLAALERESFEISDDRLKVAELSKPAPAVVLVEQVVVESENFTVEPVSPHSLARVASTVEFPTAPQLSSVSAALASPGSGSPPLVNPQSSIRTSTAMLAQSLNRASNLNPGSNQRTQKLLNQAKFMDLNLQLTSSAEGTVLWIRDFKQKYSLELYNWAKDLESVLQEQGQTLSRIMLNGKPINHISDILGS